MFSIALSIEFFLIIFIALWKDPTPGKITIFPSTLPHYTDEYLGDGERITIAFDIFVKNHTTITKKWSNEEFFGDNIKKLDI